MMARRSVALVGMRAMSSVSPSTVAAQAPPAPTKTYANQAKLPSLPIPDLQHTASVYLRSVQPLLTTHQGNGDIRQIDSRPFSLEQHRS